MGLNRPKAIRVQSFRRRTVMVSCVSKLRAERCWVFVRLFVLSCLSYSSLILQDLVTRLRFFFSFFTSRWGGRRGKWLGSRYHRRSQKSDSLDTLFFAMSSMIYDVTANDKDCTTPADIQGCLFVGWLLNVPATCDCISGTVLKVSL